MVLKDFHTQQKVTFIAMDSTKSGVISPAGSTSPRRSSKMWKVRQSCMAGIREVVRGRSNMISFFSASRFVWRVSQMFLGVEVIWDLSFYPGIDNDLGIGFMIIRNIGDLLPKSFDAKIRWVTYICITFPLNVFIKWPRNCSQLVTQLVVKRSKWACEESL